ncbi:tetratricopeptide repeat protein [Caecibacteroides pullorum]|uniref:Tetratricopeptide repeat protein n=1 Tax=Caecibacteroides pullorum TaxID=2725562 RepID=A0AA40ZS58_9BACT|nr:tetratricopeptide repeat protein [Caecibacteroides pullorum]MBM6856930.1 tetratricopeptide repeat protein [Caecibacteroides pullorum]MBV8057937.1 tetratricopeptide repeat protein [Caecibacteroides pullorum]
MTAVQLQQWIQHPETLNQDSLYELRTLVARYPYFQSVRLLYLKNLYLLHDVSFGAELRKAVLYVADRRSLFYLIEGENYKLNRNEQSVSILEKDEPGIDRTLFLIDAFLSKMPDVQSQSSELDYTMDYTAYLLHDDKADDVVENKMRPLRGQDLIDGFLNKMNADEKNLPTEQMNADKSQMDKDVLLADVSEESTSPLISMPISVNDDQAEDEEEEKGEDCVVEREDDSYFTETLAKIYIKQHRYEKALEIIKKLSLNYPKKNAYFADQIRFLEKLIINAKSK